MSELKIKSAVSGIPSAFLHIDDDAIYVCSSVTGEKIFVVDSSSYVYPGQPIVPVSAISGSVVIPPEDGKIYKYTAAASDVISINTSSLSSSHAVTFELWVTQPSTAVSFTLPTNVTWGDGESFSSQYSAPEISTASTLYCIVFRWNGTRLLGNLAYKESL